MTCNCTLKSKTAAPKGGSKALPWSLRTLTFALVWNPESHHLMHWLSALVSSASGYSSYPHSLFLGKFRPKREQLDTPAIRTCILQHLDTPAVRTRFSATGHSSYPHKFPQQLETLVIRTRPCGSDATESSNWTPQLSAQEFPSNWTFQLSAQESPSN